ncbi:MAG: GDP-mannose 4,6-dehydratase [Candidatus Omnitrophota bacterium]
MSKILITGGAGFIGSHLAERFIAEGNEVAVVDDLSTGKKENISALLNHKNFSFYEGTILNYPLMERLISHCEEVFHFAAAVGVKYIIENPRKSILINVRGTEIVAELVQKFRKKIFFSSTSEIYGKNNKANLSEDDDRILGSTKISRWSYSCTKALDEFLLLSLQREYNLPVIIARLFNTCGPRQSNEYGMVIPRFVSQALSNEPVTVYGDGKQVRSFTYITDTIEAITQLSKCPESIGDVFNIGSNEIITIGDLAEKIITKTGSSSKITFIPYNRAYRQGFEDMRYRVPNIGKISKLTQYRPKFTLDQMLTEIILRSKNNDF